MTRTSRRVPLALTVGGAIRTWPGTHGNLRIPFQYGVTVPRWRLHFHNINPREGRPGDGRYTLPAVVLGVSDGKGGWADPPRVISEGLEAAGASTATPPHDTPLDAGVEYLLAYEWNAEHPTKRVVGGGWIVSDLLDPAASVTPTPHHPLDVWIEADVSMHTPVLAVFGDSIASGVSATAPVRDSWPSIYARRIGALPIHYTASGDTMKGWSDPSHYKWQRWQHLTPPDMVVHAMGLNDVNGGHPIWEMQRRHLETTRILHEHLSRNVRVATLTPSSQVGPDLNTSRRTYNAWLMDRNPDALRLHGAVSKDDRRLSPGFDADGTHMKTSGYRAMASKVPDLFA